MSDQFQKLRLRQLDKKLKALRENMPIQRPKGGWIRTLREALGMTTQQLADRLDVSQSAVTQYEQREVDDGISLRTLRKVAAGLECDLVYAFVPRNGLQEILEKRAGELAEHRLEQVSQTMRLEDQEISSQERERRLREYSEELLREDRRKLWDEE